MDGANALCGGDAAVTVPNLKEQILFSWHEITVSSITSSKKGIQKRILSNVSGWVRGGEVVLGSFSQFRWLPF